MKLLDQRDDVIRVYVDERHETFEARHQGMTAAAKIILTIIITAMTGGGGLLGAGGSAGGAAAGGAAAGGAATGAAASTVTMSGVMSAVGTGIAQGALSAVSNHLMFSMIDNRMNMANVGRDMTSSSTLKGIGISAVSQGLTRGMETGFDIGTTGMHGFVQQVQGNAIKAVAHAATRIAFGEKPKEVLKTSAINYAVDVASGTLANEIGDWRKLNIDAGLFSDCVTHKLLHGVLGATSRGLATKLLGGNSAEVTDAGLGGAIGAMTAEMVAEGLRERGQEAFNQRFITESEGKTPQEILTLARRIEAEELNKIRAYGELVATITAQAFDADVSAACSAARNALDNNFVFLAALPEALALAAEVGTVAWRAYRIYRTAKLAANLAKAGSEVLRENDEIEEASPDLLSLSGGSSSCGSGGPQLPEDPERRDKDKKVTDESTSTLNTEQLANFKRFMDKAPSNAENIKIRDLPDGGKVFQLDSPATNIPGSFARYEKQVDNAGTTLQYTKTTYNANRQIIHVAPKFPIGPKIKVGE
ncbi:MAG: hypothetical protein K0M45_03100 [Candidatus Paracaedibacteraceae bacterium]|nr:hypothetical protein [Candidatus Paracaedibacteraceae bacterium]